MSHALSPALGGGLLAAAVTGVLYAWGRAYYEGYLDAFGVSNAAASVPLADVLFAPFNTLLSSWIRIAVSVAASGLLGMIAVLTGKGARWLAGKLRQAPSPRVQKFVRWLTAPVSAHQSVDALEEDHQFYSATRTVFAGLLLLLAGVAVIVGGWASLEDGRRDGRATAKQCVKQSAVTVERESGQPPATLRAHVGDALIMYIPSTMSIAVEKWDKQRIRAVMPKKSLE